MKSRWKFSSYSCLSMHKNQWRVWQIVSQIESESVWKSISQLVTQTVSLSVSRNKKKNRSERDRSEKDRRERILLERDRSERDRSDRHTPESRIFPTEAMIWRNLSRKIWIELVTMPYFVRSNIFEVNCHLVFQYYRRHYQWSSKIFKSIKRIISSKKMLFLFLHSNYVS